MFSQFFDKAKNMDSIVAISPIAFSEISSHYETFSGFRKIYLKEGLLKIIQEWPSQIMKREIDTPIESYLFFRKKDVNLSVINRKKTIREKQYNEGLKKKWKENFQQTSIDFSKWLSPKNGFSLKLEERNKQIEEKLENGKFLKHYMEKENFVLDIFRRMYNINFPKTEIYSNKNRYKYINFFQHLMFINLCKSLISGKSEFSPKKGDLFDMRIASYSAFSYCFISEDKGLIKSLQILKDTYKEIDFENKCKIYHKIEDFVH